jgi:hypothetical protein
VLGVVRREVVEQPRRAGHRGPRSWVVGVEGAQRVGVDPPADVLGQLALVLAQVAAQLVEVGGAGVERAEARQPQPDLAHSGRLEQLGEQQDRLGVERRVVGSERLDADLRELAVASRLGALVTEERAPVPELHGLGKLVHAVLDVGARDAGGALRAQRQRAAAAVLKGEHLLADDVGRLPHPAREEVSVLDHRRLEWPVAVAAEHRAGAAVELAPALAVVGQHVECAPRGLQPAGHR